MAKYNSFEITLDANAQKEIEGFATAVRVLEATGDIHIGFNHGGVGPAFKGFRYTAPESEPVRSIQLIDVSGAANTVVLGISVGTTEDNRISGEVTAEIDPGSTFATLADATLVAAAAAAVLLAANTARREVILTAPLTNAAAARIGDSNIGAARGLLLNPGEQKVISTKAVVYGYAPAGANLVVNIAYTAD